MSEWLLENEHIDDLQRNGLKIIQSERGFRFGMDAVLLADFTDPRPRERWADFGTGTGILPILLSQKDESVTFEVFELQKWMADMACRSFQMNGLDSRIHVHCEDIREACHVAGYETMDGIVTNPPYGKRGSTLHSPVASRDISCHETDCSLEEWIRSAAKILKNHGRLSIVFPAQRLFELTDVLRACRLEPKRIRMVCAKASKAPYLFLLEAVKEARPSVLWMPPLIVYHEDGTPTDELRKIYHITD